MSSLKSVRSLVMASGLVSPSGRLATSLASSGSEPVGVAADQRFGRCDMFSSRCWEMTITAKRDRA